ncbi:hypothetical protein B0H17DRAFT_1122397 [Mycena rosella]|uniref:DUF4246 domain-containing protein n=1 Tax=Mycena rosella TaxID=1033263 RepID=A0AAD7F7T1_MYCRO|nr:hypothetical protein B0H17DRAFT_1122397 [Mycena rosella]
MPSDFTVDEKDGSVKLASPYVNNLHPGLHQPLYRVIEEVLTGFVPMFERVLGDTNREGERSPFSNQDRDEDEFNEKFYASADKYVPEAEEYTGQLEARFDPVSQPEYAGGSWHVEGTLEPILPASGIYPQYHGQDDGICMQMLYGMDRDSECIQEIGAMVTKAGRALSWPNLFQHCPGHRKILAIFLVNPTVDPIVSATDELPQELRHLVKDHFPATVMSLKEAEAYRLRLMKERTAFVKKHTGTAYGNTFNMCEH